jgi:hypothetical protein
MAKRTETRAASKRARPVYTPEDDGARSTDEVAVAIAGDIIGQGTELTKESLRAVSKRARKLGPLGLDSASTAVEKTAEVTDELAKAGPAFGDFVEKIGLAVAKAQTELDKTFVATAKELSSQKIKVISVFEQQLKDADGTLEKGVIHESELPLINYLMPVGYKWSRVYLESDMKVSEFKSDVGFKIQSKSTSVGASAKASYGLIGGFGASGSASFSHSQSETGVAASTSVDTAAGSMHMEATLEPRNDITLPQPFILQKGPRLQVTLESMKLLQREEGQDPDKKIVVYGREAEIKVSLFQKDGAANKQKQIEFKIDQPQVLIDAPSTKTSDTGEMTIKLTRQGPAFDPTKPLSTTLRVWFGFVAETITLSL